MESDLPDQQLFAVTELAKRLGVSESTLNKWRLTGVGPRFVKIGRLVKYRGSDVSEWLERQVRISTSDQGRAA
jgi:excisionase family DNA binding protein